MNVLAPATGRRLTLRAGDGEVLTGHLFAARAPRAGVLLVGATAVPQRYYARFATFLAERGLTVLTFDYRGIGASRHGELAGHPATMRDWGEHDVTGALARLRDEVPGLPVLAVGHSFGGQALGLSDALGEVDGMLTVGAQLGWAGHWSGLGRLHMLAVWHLLFPAALATWGYVPGWLGMGEDLPPGVAREWRTWCLSPGYLLDHVPEAHARLARFRGHLEVWGFTDDAYAPEAAVRAYADAVRPVGRTLRLRTPRSVGATRMGHFGMFRPAAREGLWVEAAELLEAWADGADVAAEPAREGER